MSQTTNNTENGSAAGENQPALETFCAGDPFEYAMQGIDEIPGRKKNSNDTLADAITDTYGLSVSSETGSILEQLNNANDSKSLVNAVTSAGLDSVEDWSDRFSEAYLREELDEVENPDLGTAMRIIDTTLSESLCPREKDAAKCTTKRERERIYIPECINSSDDGTVYMAKTLSSDSKLRIAWDLNDSNQVVVVDEYEKWENLLGWKKLKSLPHGKNKIREELGDQLSDEVLEVVAGEQAGDTDTQDDSDSTSRGRRTRTKPSKEELNLARGSRQRQRTKMLAEDIADTFDDGDTIGYNDISMLVLFPSTTDLNMTDHWWIAGSRWAGGGSVAIANCNKGTFEYLNQYEEVWHVEDYLEQATDYEFETSAGPLTMNTAATDPLVFHIATEETRKRFVRDGIIENIPELLAKYVEEEMYSRRAPELPHPDDMVYAPITPEDAFWMRPELRKQQSPEDGDAVICYADVNVRNLGNIHNVSSDYWLYSRARLSDWDFDTIEMESLSDASHYLALDEGGYELIETLGKLHDNGEQPFSETPESRWK